MKYCIKYANDSNFKYFNDTEISEIEIVYKREDLSLPDFIEKYSNKNIVIAYIPDSEKIEEDIKRFTALYKKYNNIKFKIPYDQTVVEFTIAKLPFFVDQIPVSTDQLNAMIDLHLTDIYIGNELGFLIPMFCDKIRENNIQIRCIPNYAQSAWKDEPFITKFFIRPEELSLYEDYIDICEFKATPDRQSVFYEIYQKDKMWGGDLQAIIHSDVIVYDFIPNALLPAPTFGLTRLKCKKKCGVDGKCKICHYAQQYAQDLHKQLLKQ